MSLNIKSDKTHRMAKELARLTGESMTVAVGEAVRERLGWTCSATSARSSEFRKTTPCALFVS